MRRRRKQGPLEAGKGMAPPCSLPPSLSPRARVPHRAGESARLIETRERFFNSPPPPKKAPPPHFL